MSRFALQFIKNATIKPTSVVSDIHIFNEDMYYYICSFGGSGSTVLASYLSQFGNVRHIHSRCPPQNLQYVGSDNSDENIYREWFNNVEIPENKLQNYKVIFIYRHPINAIFSRFVLPNGPRIAHLKNIQCDNDGNINIFDVLKTKKDLYKIEEFFDNYTTISHKRNYNIYCVKYELFWNNISTFNKMLNIPDNAHLYPIKQERSHKFQFVAKLNIIYNSLLHKMNRMKFIEIIHHSVEEENALSF